MFLLAVRQADVEFKVTQGAWVLVEQDSKGRNIPNRRVSVSQPADGTQQRISVTVERWATPNRTESTVTGTLIVHQDFRSEYLQNPRQVSVWLPPGYENSEDTYPVVYLHDGQNLFDAAKSAFRVEWEADETATRLIMNNEIRPMILVGIWNTPEWIDEYTMTKDSQLGRGGQGRKYLQFLVDEFKPVIDRTYRTRPERESTLIAGSSLGGMISMHACVERPDIFGGCIALSPSLGWDEERFLRASEAGSDWTGNLPFWFSMGTREDGRNDGRYLFSGISRRHT